MICLESPSGSEEVARSCHPLQPAQQERSRQPLPPCDHGACHQNNPLTWRKYLPQAARPLVHLDPSQVPKTSTKFNHYDSTLLLIGHIGRSKSNSHAGKHVAANSSVQSVFGNDQEARDFGKLLSLSSPTCDHRRNTFQQHNDPARISNNDEEKSRFITSFYATRLRRKQLQYRNTLLLLLAVASLICLHNAQSSSGSSIPGLDHHPGVVGDDYVSDSQSDKP